MGGLASEVAAKLLAHHGLAASPSPALLAALADALSAGEGPSALLERLAARGRLAGATDPMAVLVTRARAVKDEIIAARDEADRRRVAELAEQRRRVEARAEEERERERTAAEDRWAASVLQRVPSGHELGLATVIAARPIPVAAHIHQALGDLIAYWPELDPAALANRWAEHPCSPEELDPTGLPPRHDPAHGPPGSFPHASDGPSLAERLRNQSV